MKRAKRLFNCSKGPAEYFGPLIYKGVLMPGVSLALKKSLADLDELVNMLINGLHADRINVLLIGRLKSDGIFSYVFHHVA